MSHLGSDITFQFDIADVPVNTAAPHRLLSPLFRASIYMRLRARARARAYDPD
jgi:hypothetical protein